MATNNFKPFGIAAGANVTSQADYEALAALLNGFQSGKASSAQINKALRQGTVMAAVLAQFISDTASVDVLDNGNTATILANMKSGLTNLTPGRLLNIQIFTSNSTYTPTPGTKSVIVEAAGGGGGGGGTFNTGSGQRACAGGGGAGGAGRARFTSGFSGVAVTIGQGGTGGAANTNSAGGAGGSTSFGSLLVCTGGGGGTFSSPWGIPIHTTGGLSGLPSGVNISQYACSPGRSGYYSNNGWLSCEGTSSPFGRGGQQAGGTSVGFAAVGYGCGGGGAVTGDSAAGQVGGAGSNGVVIVWEYA